MREKKWHVFNDKDQPLCWDGQAIEFDTEKDAKVFLSTAIYGEIKMLDEGMRIEERILYYDGGHINLTGCTLDEEGNLLTPSETLS